MIKQVIWDFGGTLVDTYSYTGHVFLQALKEYGVSISRQQALSLLLISRQYAIDTVCQQFALPDSFIQRFQQLQKEMEFSDLRLFDGVKECLDQLHQQGIQQFLITHRGQVAKRYLQHVGLASHFTKMICKEDGYPRKPDPQSVYALMDEFAFQADTLCLIGDRKIEVELAKNVGCPCYIYHAGYVPLQEIMDWQPDCIFEAYSKFPLFHK